MNKPSDSSDKHFDKIETELRGILNDLLPLKDACTREAALREAGLIAESMGFWLTRILPVSEIKDLMRSCDTTGIPKNELRLFRLADLIMEVEDGQGERRYIAVEISFTAGSEDTTRAIRNAGFLTRFTGRPAHAVIAGWHTHDRIRESIASGEVSWYRLNAHNLGIE